MGGGFLHVAQRHARIDVVLVGPAAEFWELKSGTGTIEPDQAGWLRRLGSAGARVRLIRPDAWPYEIRALLRVIRGR